MLERMIEKLDILPGGKTYMLAAAAALLFWLEMVGLIPTDLYNMLLPWIVGPMAGTVALKAARP